MTPLIPENSLSLVTPDSSTQTDEEIATAAANTILYRHGDAECQKSCIPSLSEIILAAITKAKAASTWTCGCGTVNGINLGHCIACNRTLGESLAECATLKAKAVREEKEQTP